MTNSKSTKRALLTSVFAVVICVAMLIGTTFAWFTDTASTGVNKITSGNLHIEIQDKNNKKIENLQWIKEDGSVIENQEKILWEPGCTYLLTPFKIVNTGNLALKYKIIITGLDGDSPLLEVIKFTYKTEDGNVFDIDAEGHLTPAGTDNASTKLIAISAHMDETAGNTYMDKTLEGIKFTVVATQDTVESDSINNEYDAKATYPVIASNQQELNDTIENATQPVTIDLATGTYTLPDVSNKDIAILGTKDTVIDMKGADGKGLVRAHANSLNFEGVTVNFGTDDYKGFQHTGKLVYRDCTITGKQFLYANEVEFINCKFTQENVDYNVWTYGAGKVLFKDCEFNCKGKSVLIYGDSSPASQTVEFQSCKFKASAPSYGKAAIEIDSYVTSYNVIIDQATADNVTGFGTGTNSKNSVWNVKRLVKPVTVTVAGTVVYNK